MTVKLKPIRLHVLSRIVYLDDAASRSSVANLTDACRINDANLSTTVIQTTSLERAFGTLSSSTPVLFSALVLPNYHRTSSLSFESFLDYHGNQ